MKSLLIVATLFISLNASANINCTIFKAPYTSNDIVRQIKDLGQDFLPLDSGVVVLNSDSSGKSLFVSWKGLKSMSPLEVGKSVFINVQDGANAYMIQCERSEN